MLAASLNLYSRSPGTPLQRHRFSWWLGFFLLILLKCDVVNECALPLVCTAYDHKGPSAWATPHGKRQQSSDFAFVKKSDKAGCAKGRQTKKFWGLCGRRTYLSKSAPSLGDGAPGGVRRATQKARYGDFFMCIATN